MTFNRITLTISTNNLLTTIAAAFLAQIGVKTSEDGHRGHSHALRRNANKIYLSTYLS